MEIKVLKQIPHGYEKNINKWSGKVCGGKCDNSCNVFISKVSYLKSSLFFS